MVGELQDEFVGSVGNYGGRQAEGISKIALSCMLPGVWQDSQLGNGTGGGDSFGGNGSEAAWCDNVSVKMMGSQVGVERYWLETWQQIDGMRRLDGWLGWQLSAWFELR